jgi:hypothetical protein
MNNGEIMTMREQLSNLIEETLTKKINDLNIDNLQLNDIRLQNELIINQLTKININIEGLMNKILR